MATLDARSQVSMSSNGLIALNPVSGKIMLSSYSTTTGVIGDSKAEFEASLIDLTPARRHFYEVRAVPGWKGQRRCSGKMGMIDVFVLAASCGHHRADESQGLKDIVQSCIERFMSVNRKLMLKLRDEPDLTAGHRELGKGSGGGVGVVTGADGD